MSTLLNDEFIRILFETYGTTSSATVVNERVFSADDLKRAIEVALEFEKSARVLQDLGQQLLEPVTLRISHEAALLRSLSDGDSDI